MKDKKSMVRENKVAWQWKSFLVSVIRFYDIILITKIPGQLKTSLNRWNSANKFEALP